MEAILAILATEAGAALVVAAVTGITAVVQTLRQQGAQKAAVRAAQQASQALDGLGVVAYSIEQAHARAIAAGDQEAAQELAALKHRIRQLSELARVEGEVIAPIVREIQQAVAEINAIVGATPASPSSALEAVRDAREKWQAIKAERSAYSTSIMRGFGPLAIVAAAPFLLASCATYSVLCPPRLTGEFVEPGDPIAVVLTLPEGAPAEIEWYILKDHEDGTRTLTFPIFFEEWPE